MPTDESRDPRHPDLPLRVEALEGLLQAKGLIDPASVDELIRAYEQDVGPMNGARVVARAWVDPEYRRRLLADGTASIAELGFGGPQAEHMVVVAGPGGDGARASRG